MGTALLHNRVISTSGGLPNFTYSGEHALVEEDGGWKVRFLTSGTLTLNKKATVDIFCVGGGGGGNKNMNSGGGGGGGYTATKENVILNAGEYVITVGAGGNAASPGGETSFADVLAVNGGLQGTTNAGGNGGSGGGSGSNGSTTNGGSGGYDGSDGESMGSSDIGGTGQKSTTREFGEDNGTLYAGGGGGGAMSNSKSAGVGGDGGGGDGGKMNDSATSGEPNTGGGGGGSRNGSAGAGGSGIVIIRNARG